MQALDLFSTGGVEEEIFISKQGRSGGCHNLVPGQQGFQNLEKHSQPPADEFKKKSANGYIIHEDKSLWRNKPGADVKLLF